ncbi:MAG TPA: type II secretion system protein [Candidatus Brocadiia bacterium]|nr:type II secretion system protein [Candidatus Brocadiia bacterium]
MRLQARARRRAFTLIEMIFVMGIISLLMSILLPAVDMARRQARMAVCVNNLRQIGQAMDAYGRDHDDYIPSVLARTTPPDLSPSWSLLPMAQATEAAPDRLGFAAYCKDNRILRCPEVTRLDRPSYGVNGRVTDAVRRFRQIPNPSETPISFDTRVAVGYYTSDMERRHLNHANILYADTHVETRYADFLLDFTGATPLRGAGGGSGGGGGGGGDPSDPSTPEEPAPPSGATFNFVLRMAGQPWNWLAWTLKENGVEFANATMTRSPGSPNEQTINLGPYFLDPQNKTYTVTVSTDGTGGNPVWMSINGSSWNKITTLNHNRQTRTEDITSLLQGNM